MSESSHRDRLITIFSGHDTVIAPVLAALGVFNGKYCGWPAYASRIVFELYSKKNLKFSNSSELLNNSYIKIYYNGDEVTSKIPACYEEKNIKSNKYNACSLNSFASQIDRMIFPYNNLEDACLA